MPFKNRTISRVRRNPGTSSNVKGSPGIELTLALVAFQLVVDIALQ